MACESVALLKHLDSIVYDAEYVRRCAQSLQLPVVGNQRCGSWYVPPDILAEQCYFKSTDGHVNKWAFNHRRLNLHLLPLIEANSGCIIVDSTKGDKRFSDASSKTIPIWCAVLNRLLFPAHGWAHDVVLPPSNVVSSTEAQQIRRILPSLQTNAERLKLDIRALRTQLTRSLIPFFLETPSSIIDTTCANGGHSIVILMASTNQSLSDCNEEVDFPFAGYIRGAGDDEDNWSHSITPTMLWAENQALVRALKQPDLDFHSTIRAALRSAPGRSSFRATPLGQTGIYIGVQPTDCSNAVLDVLECYNAVIFCESSDKPEGDAVSLTKEINGSSILRLQLSSGKVGSRLLRTVLPDIVRYVSALPDTKPTILVADKTGSDLAVGVSLAVLCIFYQSGHFDRLAEVERMDKELIRTHLALISASKSDANPSRATLQSIHAFLMPEDGLAGLKTSLKRLICGHDIQDVTFDDFPGEAQHLTGG